MNHDIYKNELYLKSNNAWDVCMLLCTLNFTHAVFIPFLVIHVWQPHFPLNGIQKNLIICFFILPLLSHELFNQSKILCHVVFQNWFYLLFSHINCNYCTVTLIHWTDLLCGWTIFMQPWFYATVRMGVCLRVLEARVGIWLLCCFTSTEAGWPIRDGDRVGRGQGDWLDRGNRPKKTGETVDRRQNNGSVKAVSPRHCPATCALRNCSFNCCAGQSH